MLYNAHITGRLVAARQHDLLEAAERQRLAAQVRMAAKPATARRPRPRHRLRRTPVAGRRACASCPPPVTR